MKSKRGWTFIELAVVLAVVGVLIGIALKGIELYHSAKARQDISNIRSIQEAIGSFYIKYHRLPGMPAGINFIQKSESDAAIRELADKGSINREDFIINTSGDKLEWYFTGCYIHNNNALEEDQTDADYTCLTLGKQTAYNQITCIMEIGIDGYTEPAEEMSNSGEARFGVGGSVGGRYFYIRSFGAANAPQSIGECKKSFPDKVLLPNGSNRDTTMIMVL